MALGNLAKGRFLLREEIMFNFRKEIILSGVEEDSVKAFCHPDQIEDAPVIKTKEKYAKERFVIGAFTLTLSLMILCGYSYARYSQDDGQENEKQSSYENFEYEFSEDGITIKDYKDKLALKIDIPDRIDGKAVTKIGKKAFSCCFDVAEIRLPEGLIEIGEGAFLGCSSLTEIRIPDSVTEIESEAFDNCSLSEITIPNNVKKIGKFAFHDCRSLTKVVIPDSVTEIGESIFHGCSSLTTIDVSSNNPNYKSIDGVLFTKDGKELIGFPESKEEKEFQIPDSVTKIGKGAFHGCSLLTKVVIPDSVTEIEKRGFHDCPSLTTFDVSSNNPNFKSIDGVLFTKDGKELIDFPAGKEEKEYHIPEGVTKIREEAFWCCSSLTEIKIPYSVTEIGKNAFWCCSSLTEIKIPDNVTEIGDMAFYHCSSLTKVVIPDSATEIEKRGFHDCPSLTTFDVSSNNPNFKSIDGVLFSKDGKELIVFPAGKEEKEYHIPEGVTKIREEAFWRCSSLTEIKIPDSVTEIGDMAFYHCSSLTEVNIPDGVNKIEDAIFASCYSLTKINIPDSVTEIGRLTFSNCFSLTKINIPDGVTKIGKNAFDFCLSLTTIDVSSNNPSFKSIGGVLFTKDGKELICFPPRKKEKEYHIPDSVTEIEENAIRHCSSLTKIKIPAGVTEIEGRVLLEDCSSLTTIDVSSNNPSFKSIDGILFTKDGKGLICFPPRKKEKEYHIPDGVTEIGENAFCHCSSLTKIKIPDSVTEIGRGAFSGSSLTNVNIPAGVKKIEKEAFSGSSLRAIKIPDSVTEIGGWAFIGCSSLTKIKIPAGVKKIERWTFTGCSSLREIKIPDSVTEIGVCAFSDCFSLTKIKIPKSVTKIYKSTFSDSPVTIYGEQGSYAEEYAKKQGIPFADETEF